MIGTRRIDVSMTLMIVIVLTCIVAGTSCNSSKSKERERAFQAIVQADNAQSNLLLESIYSGRSTGGEIQQMCREQLAKRTDAIARVKGLDFPYESGARDTYQKLLEAQNRLVRAIGSFEYGRLQLASDEDVLSSTERLQNYQLVPEWQAKVKEDRQQTDADRRALTNALDGVITLEKQFKAAVPASLGFEAVHSNWQQKVMNDVQRTS